MALAQITPTVDGLPDEDTVSLWDYWRVLVRRRALILGVMGVIAVTAVLFTLWQPAIYESTAALMPLGTSRGGLPAAFGELSGILPVLGTGFGRESPTDRLLAVLQSRTLALDVIQHLHLLPMLFEKQWDATQQQWRKSPPPTLQDAVRQPKKAVSITANRQGVITIAVEHTDPVLAAAIANRYIYTLPAGSARKRLLIGQKKSCVHRRTVNQHAPGSGASRRGAEAIRANPQDRVY